jgi:hypothetical protein
VKVLDIAAGHGLFGIEIARQNPQARVTGLDWAPVLRVALENARKAGVQDRYDMLPGSAFQVDFGGPYDVVLLTNFLHHFDQPTCVGLLKKGSDNQFPKFETYREQVDGRYWFPTYTIANDTLHFQNGPQRIKMTVKYEDYKRFEGRSTIQFGDVVEEKPATPAPPKK